MQSYQRPILDVIEQRLKSDPPLLHVMIGPRQVGKSTAAAQLIKRLGWPAHYAAADAPLTPPAEWIETQWQLARQLATGPPALLILDEVQKVRGWSEVVKRLWDEDRRNNSPLRILLLGSSSLLVQEGLIESLTGRFMLHRFTHWTFAECRQAFGWDLDRWIFYGGYPGAAALVDHLDAWKLYVADSLIETVLSRDVLQMQTIHKPALLRHLFLLAAAYPAQILSYNKMLGQLQDAGNTTTLAHYLQVLQSAFLASGLEQYSRGHIRHRGSSPKLVLWNNALITSLSLRTPSQSRSDGPWWGRLVENAVGAHLLNGLQGPQWNVAYWRDGNDEVDYVVSQGTRTWALEVKSGRPQRTSGLTAFRRRWPDASTWIIGQTGVPLEDFFSKPAADWFQETTQPGTLT